MGTIRIKSSNPEQQGPFVLIEEEDFDGKKHKRYEDPKPVVSQQIQPQQNPGAAGGVTNTQTIVDTGAKDGAAGDDNKPKLPDFAAMSDEELVKFVAAKGRTPAKNTPREELIKQATSLAELNA